MADAFVNFFEFKFGPRQASRYFKFKSAGDSHGSGLEIGLEFYREMLTEYIWHGGKIRGTDRLRPEDKEAIEKLCHWALSQYVGKVLIEGMDFH